MADFDCIDILMQTNLQIWNILFVSFFRFGWTAEAKTPPTKKPWARWSTTPRAKASQPSTSPTPISAPTKALWWQSSSWMPPSVSCSMSNAGLGQRTSDTTGWIGSAWFISSCSFWTTRRQSCLRRVWSRFKKSLGEKWKKCVRSEFLFRSKFWKFGFQF